MRGGMPRILFAIVSLLPFTAAALAQSNPPNLPDPTFSQSAGERTGGVGEPARAEAIICSRSKLLCDEMSRRFEECKAAAGALACRMISSDQAAVCSASLACE
jgi:hypothetical protein